MFNRFNIFVVVSIATGAIAGENCKCQAADGKGPSWNVITDYCCLGNGGVLFGTTKDCFPGTAYFPGGSDQVLCFNMHSWSGDN
ncbi:hypothetical protein BKA70DRAFT_1445006 [Coprinopsis sp. MPI-PUGE-AT-0042]|nr:hypothetical protein BKA70DRAFT_1445006 [Coprinopsis sp. MPI-PUGE-AT-0042]